jgi:hypothetical protein
MQWRKLFDLDPLYAVASDKLAVRDFIAERVGAEMLIPILWFGNDPDAIPFDTLDPPYVIKSTHAASHIFVVRQRTDVAADSAAALFNSWLACCYGTLCDEPGYVPVPRRLLVERMLLRADGSRPLERKFFVFNGRVRFVQTLFPDEAKIQPRHGAYHDRDWRPLEWYLKTPNEPEMCPLPKRYDEMIAVAERLGKDFDHVRIDIYDADDSFWVGELTLYSWSGLTRFCSDEADRLVGSYWSLQRPVRRALRTMLRQWRKILPGETSGQFGDRLAHPTGLTERRHTSAK